MVTQETVAELGWEILPHPKYSSDMAPSDNHLFRSLEHYLRRRLFKDVGEVRKCIEDFMSLKPPSFYLDGIGQLPDKWRKVVTSDGNYFLD